MADAPIIITADVAAEKAAIIAYYEAQTGRIVNEADTEMFIFNTLAYQITLYRASANYAAVQNLVDFANAPMIDYLGQLLGVTRLAASPALCTLRFQLATGHTGVTVPAGTRVQSTDGKVIFETIDIANAVTGETFLDVAAECATAGIVGNGYGIGVISNLLDPQAFIDSVANTDATAGGADQESDDELRERIKQAPAQFTTAGSRASYEFHAKSASPAIVDVTVLGPFPIPGSVSIYPLMDVGGTTPTEILDLVYAACNAENVRPLCDTVIVESPTQVDFDLYAKLTLYNDADGAAIQAEIDTDLAAFLVQKRQELGADIVLEQLVEVAQRELVYKCEFFTDSLLTVPFVDITISPTEFAQNGTLVVSIGGYTAG